MLQKWVDRNIHSKKKVFKQEEKGRGKRELEEKMKVEIELGERRNYGYLVQIGLLKCRNNWR